MRCSERAQTVIIYRLQAAQPLQSRLPITPLRQLSCAADSTAQPVHPDTNHEPRIKRWLSGMTFHRFHLFIKWAQLQPPYEFPNGSGYVLFWDESVDIRVQHHQLIEVHQAHA